MPSTLLASSNKYSFNSSFVKKDDNVRMDAFLNDGKEQIIDIELI